MAENDPAAPVPKPGLGRRAFLLGAAGGAAATALGAAGVVTVREKQRKLVTPKAVASGAAAEVAESFADSHPAYASETAASS